jgi:hypothetical protein
MANDDVRPSECIRDHLCRILSQLGDNLVLGLARPSAAGVGRSSLTIFDPTTGQTVTIRPKPRTRT